MLGGMNPTEARYKTSDEASSLGSFAEESMQLRRPLILSHAEVGLAGYVNVSRRQHVGVLWIFK